MAIVAYLVQEKEENLSLTDVVNLVDRDLASLSRAAGRIRERIRENLELADKISPFKRTTFENVKMSSLTPFRAVSVRFRFHTEVPFHPRNNIV